MRIQKTFPITDRDIFYKQMLNWANRFNICSFLANHNYAAAPNYQETIVAAGTVSIFHFSPSASFNAIDHFIEQQKDWIFFHISFEALSILEKELHYEKDKTGFAPFSFFIPQYVLKLKGNEVDILSLQQDHDHIFQEISSLVVCEGSFSAVTTQPRISKGEYIERINSLLKHIQRGDCYEINFCQEFYSEAAMIDPCSVWLSLCRISPNPFSVFYKSSSSYLLSASPERFLCRQGDQLISQPMKGTIRRDLGNPEEDAALRIRLQQSEKDRMENVMVVDLVRNDLSKVCNDGTVNVRELFGVYPFPQVYQMISTVEGSCRKGITFMDILCACFPMGSMTGAPKVRVLELIREYEEQPRGLFSGSVGYITPEGDFDMNVVIRSIFYHAETGYLSFMTGSGITASSIPELEYEECLLKGSAIRAVLS